MPGLYAPYKTYSSGEILTAADLNATDTNHITNQTPEMTDDYSADAATYALTTTPSISSLPTSLAEDIRHIRGGIKQSKGTQNWYDLPSIVTVGTYGDYTTLALALVASKSRIRLVSDLTTIAEIDWTLSNGVIDFNGYSLSGTSAITGSILKVSGNENSLRDIIVQGTHTSGTTTNGLEITGARNQGHCIKIFQNGAGGTMTDGLDISGANNQIDAIIDNKAGTITNAFTDTGTLTDARIIDMVS